MNLQVAGNINEPQRVVVEYPYKQVEEPDKQEVLQEQAPAIVTIPSPQPKPDYRMKGSYYQTISASPRDFEFRMSSAHAAGLACGPSNRGLLHHVVFSSEHPAASLTLIEGTVTLTAAKMVEAGVEVKIDNSMEHSLQSMADPSLEIESYEGIIKTLQSDPNLRNDVEKQRLLAILQTALNKDEQIPFEDMTKIINICASISHVDHTQAKSFVNRMKNANILTDEQAKLVLEEAEPLYVNGKIRLSELQRLVEDCGLKVSKKTL